jgi:hypothetical protein
MPYIKSYAATVTIGSSTISIATDHHSLVQKAVHCLQNEEPNCEVGFNESGNTQIDLPGHLVHTLGRAVVVQMLKDNWQLTNVKRYGTDSLGMIIYKFTREEVFTTIADDLERLVELLANHMITAEEFNIMKRQLIDQE